MPRSAISGQLFVDPATLPAGPVLGYDRDGKLSATIYMTPLGKLENGTEAAVRELVRRLNPRLFRVARGILDSDAEAEAEEVVQEAYLSAFAHLSAFRGEARFSTWITRIVLNAARMRRRRARPEDVEYDTVAEDNSETGRLLSFPNGGIEGPESALGRSQIARSARGGDRSAAARAAADLPVA